MRRIHYKTGYKYQLAKDFFIDTGIRGHYVETDLIRLLPNGYLIVRKNYAWDGPSGPAFDTPTFMRASLIHDAFYQLMRQGHLCWKKNRSDVDKLMRKICLQDGMWRIRAWWCYRGVKKFAAEAVNPKNARKVIIAP